MNRRILFICTGNTCRSPMAEHVLKKKAAGRYEVRSAGIAAFPGQPAAPQVQQLLPQEEVHQHTAQSVTPSLMKWADLILTMTQSQRDILADQYPDHGHKVHSFKMYVRGDSAQTDADISDPIGGDLHVYEQTLAEMEELIDRFLEQGLADTNSS